MHLKKWFLYIYFYFYSNRPIQLDLGKIHDPKNQKWVALLVFVYSIRCAHGYFLPCAKLYKCPLIFSWFTLVESKVNSIHRSDLDKNNFYWLCGLHVITILYGMLLPGKIPWFLLLKVKIMPIIGTSIAWWAIVIWSPNPAFFDNSYRHIDLKQDIGSYKSKTIWTWKIQIQLNNTPPDCIMYY